MAIHQNNIIVIFILELIFLGSQASSLDLYSVCEGDVVQVVKGISGRSPALGNQVLIRRTSDGLYFRFCHMVNGSNNHISVGDHVTTGTQVGVMGSTGVSTGTHLHLECSSTYTWQCNSFLDPRNCAWFWKCKRNMCNL